MSDQNLLNTEQFLAATGHSDLWGIINWARGGVTHHIWCACPDARKHMLVAAAMRRWEAHYSDTNPKHWLAHARWIHSQLDRFLRDDHEAPRLPTPTS